MEEGPVISRDWSIALGYGLLVKARFISYMTTLVTWLSR